MSSDFQFPSTSSCFSIRAGTACGVLFRIMAVFARRGVMLSSIHARIIGTGVEVVQTIDIHVDALEPTVLNSLTASLRQIVDVERVLTTHKRVPRAA